MEHLHNLSGWHELKVEDEPLTADETLLQQGMREQLETFCTSDQREDFARGLEGLEVESELEPGQAELESVQIP